ncbi:MAG: SDR family NAD(P)-dependent oxidoreductase [Lysobacteraceae bacterium]|jgi:NAD(P)-dependent dehydrogenase (short-subunit alcohol dehydrogenase family)|nr:SDR family NAD(P)-dependent oxidoreductase [Silanimonas sp.]
MNVLVSGGSKGIGLAIAKAFLGATGNVGICARGDGALRHAVSGAPALSAFRADVSLESGCRGFVDWAVERFGGIDVLVNNAGFFDPCTLAESDTERFASAIDANLRSAFMLTKAAMPHLEASPHATIINICSVASTKGYPSGFAYSVAKHGLLGMSRSLREELKPKGIAVVAILPGATLTDSWAGVDLPAERFMRPSDIAEVAVLAHRLSKSAVLEEVVMRPMMGDIG